jgi:hypothetical protein
MTGPSITYLTERLLKTPEIFCQPPVMKTSSGKTVGKTSVIAVVSDLIYDMTGIFPGTDDLRDFELIYEKNNVNLLSIILIACHLFHDVWFLKHPEIAKNMVTFLKHGLTELSKIVNFKDFITDDERREELVRLCLHHSGVIPEGENKNTAFDRLTTLDSIERMKVIEETKKSYKRIMEIRQAIAEKEAIEAASKMTRE